jgi:hypothetical protein
MSAELNDDFSVEEAKRQFREVISLMKDAARAAMETPEGREGLRRDLAALQGVPVEMVKFEGES